MKFSRADLLARVRAEIARREQATAERVARERAEYEAKLAAHVEATGPAWSELADTIRRRVRASKPVTPADIPTALRPKWANSSSGQVAVWDGKPPPERFPNIAALEMLAGLLDATTDDEITTAALERLGFRTADLFHPQTERPRS
jgi:hypothetical protein